MGLKLDLAYATTNKYASRESGDSIDIVERPGGGIVIALVDGQGSGRPAKSLSSQVLARVIGAIKDGARESVAARLANDSLYAFRDGKVSATLDLLAIDPKAANIELHRYSAAPFAIKCGGQVEHAGFDGSALGRYYRADPASWEWGLNEPLRIVIVSDGVIGSGYRRGTEPLNLSVWLAAHPDDCPARETADALLQTSLERDDRRAADDMSVIVLSVSSDASPVLIRSGSALVPLP